MHLRTSTNTCPLFSAKIAVAAFKYTRLLAPLLLESGLCLTNSIFHDNLEQNGLFALSTLIGWVKHSIKWKTHRAVFMVASSRVTAFSHVHFLYQYLIMMC